MFDLKIVTPEGVFYNGDIEYLSFYATDGSVGIMSGALPRITVIKEGKLVIKSQTVNETFFCGDGIVRVRKEGVSAIVSYCSVAPPELVENDRALGGDGNAGLSAKEYKYLKAKLVSTIKDLRVKEKDRSQ